MKLATIVGISLAAFAYAFASIVMFGMINPVGGEAMIGFTLAYFLVSIAILGIIYIASRKQITGIFEHTAIILAILIFSAGLAAAAGNYKANLNDLSKLSQQRDTLQNDVQQLAQLNNYYLANMNSMRDTVSQLQASNKQLSTKMNDLKTEIRNQQLINDANAANDASSTAAASAPAPAASVPVTQTLPRYYQDDGGD